MRERENRPVAVVAAAVLVLIGAACLDNVSVNGMVVYLLDDPYIHLTIARNLAEHGVWGVSPLEFISASSSPLWTALLAGWHRLAGSALLAPLIVNVVCSILLILASDAGLRRLWPAYSLRARHRLAFLGILALAIPIPTLALSGMEHLLHTLFAVLFFILAATELWPGGEPPERERSGLGLCIVAALAVATRYESFSLVAPVAGLLFWRGRWKRGLALLGSSVLPVAAFGMYSYINNMPPVPASILVKTVAVAQGAPGWLMYTPLVKAFLRYCLCPVLFALTLCGAFVITRSRRETTAVPPPLAGAVGLFVASSVIHAEFASVGWLYRYEAYLVAVGMMTALPAFISDVCSLRAASPGHSASRAWIIVAVILAITWPIGLRAVNALSDTPYAYRNIGAQQIQMAKFLAGEDNPRPVALNDIGAVGYFTGTPIFDLFGLANADIFRNRMEHAFTSESMDRLARRAGAETAILYPGWFEQFGGLPASWTEVARWKIENNVVCGSDTVTFYAIASGARDDLRRRLRAFSPSLPPAVTVTFAGEAEK